MNFIQNSKSGLIQSLAIRVFLFVIFLSGCVVKESTEISSFVFMSEKREKEIGLDEHEKVLESSLVYKNEKLQKYIEEVGNRVAAASDRPDLDYTFTVIDSPEINAFALPGGYVYVNRGLLAFMNSEAELAAVLGHEIGHITARHAVQRQGRGQLAKIASAVGGFATAVATGSGYVGQQISDIASIWAQTGLSGFGREQELEADRLGAEFIVSAGYEPQAVIDVITVLKNHDDFNRKVSVNTSTYHGLFATHPRNDKRLKQAIEEVDQMSDIQPALTDNANFRAALDGLVIGESNQGQRQDKRNRYYQDAFGYTLIFPDNWEVQETITTATASDNLTGTLKIEARRIRSNISPRDYIREELGVEQLRKSEVLQQYRLLGHTGIVERTDIETMERVAVFYLGGRAIILRAIASDASTQADDVFLDVIRSFRAIQQGEGKKTEAQIKFAQASEYFDFRNVAGTSPIKEFPEETLRLLNGYYPAGKPEAGDWIKLVK